MAGVRAIAWVMFLVACDHRAAPKQDKPAAAAVTAADASAAAADRAADDACLGVGVNITEIIIAAATDPGQKAAYVQERTKLVRRFSETCRSERWSEATRACFMAAKTSADVQACSRELAKTQPSAPTPVEPPGLH